MPPSPAYNITIRSLAIYIHLTLAIYVSRIFQQKYSYQAALLLNMVKLSLSRAL